MTVVESCWLGYIYALCVPKLRCTVDYQLGYVHPLSIRVSMFEYVRPAWYRPSRY